MYEEGAGGWRRVLTGAPGAETVRFAMPARVKMRRFDEITVVFYTGGSREGARVALESFELAPR